MNEEPRPANIEEARTVVALALAKLGVRDEAIEGLTNALVHQRWLSGKPSVCLALNEPSISDGPPFALYFRWVPGLNEIERLRTKAMNVDDLSSDERRCWVESDDGVSNVAVRPIDGRIIRILPGDYVVLDRDGEVSDIIDSKSKFLSHFVPVDNAFLKSAVEFSAATGATLDAL